MGKLEKLGRSLLKKLRSSSSRRDNVPTSSSSSSDSDEYVHKFQVVPPETSDDRVGSPGAGSDEGSAGYATDDTVMSSLSPLDIKRESVDYSESQGYYSNAELSPGTVPAHLSPRQLSPTVPSEGYEIPIERRVTVPVQKPKEPAHLTENTPVPRIPGVTVEDPAHQTTSLRNTVPLRQFSNQRSTVPLKEPARQTTRSAVPSPTVPKIITVPEPAHQTDSQRVTAPSPVPRILGVTVPESAHQTQTLRSAVHTPTVPKILGVTVPEPLRSTIPGITVDLLDPVPRTTHYKKQDFPKINIRNRHHPIYKSSNQLLAAAAESNLKFPAKIERAATLSNLAAEPEDEDPIDKFMRSHIYKTKMITTVFEAKDRGFEEIGDDVIHEIDRWFETKNMMAVACELHWSVPREKRSRQLECRLKEKLLQALRENNKRLLYLRGMGHGKTPVKLAESSTVENISKDRETDSVRGIYQRSYTRLLPYLHKETPEWHSQYWTLQDLEKSDDVESPNYPIQPNPQKFLFDTEPAELLITAFNSGNELVTSSTLLKIRVENLDDNEPEFLPSALPIFQVPKNTSKPTAIGRLTARDADFSPIFYHLLPNCGTPESSDNFNIDAEFGEIVYEPKVDPSSKMTEAEVCFIATSQKNLDTSEVFFDANSKNFKRVKVEFVGDSVDSVANSGKINNGFSGNQSISSVGDVLDRVEIPMNLGAAAGAQDYELKSLNFVPANYELGRDMISPKGAVELNKNTGELVANGKILDTPQGVYTAEIGRGDGGEGVKQLHHIRNDRKLRYVLSMSRNEFGANLEKFRRQILEAIGKDDQKAGKQLEIHFDEPKADRKNSTWTSVCFYLTRQNAILDENQASSIISPSNGHISKLHHIFKVQNVDMCAPKPSATSSESTSSSNSDIPLNTLILIGVVGLLIIALLALLIYVCCVSRYQRYLKQKTDQLRCSSSAGSYYKSPNLIPPPPPGYMHTPPLPPPPPPMAIAYY